MSAAAPIRVLVADDSRTIREALVSIFNRDPGILVVGQAKDGREAVSLAKKTNPSVITMDVQMPLVNGLEATEHIMRAAPTRILMVASLSSHEAVELSFKAIAAGALEVIAKPNADDARSFGEWGARLCRSVRLMAEVPVVRRHGRKSLVPLPPSERAFARPGVDIVGIAASTGGPPALAQVLGALRADLPLPVLICQHMAPGFGAGLVRWLTEVSRLSVVVVREPTVLVHGRVYSPVDGHDLEIAEHGKVTVRPNTSPHCPSGNRLFHSLARFYGPRAAGFVLTGMGDDGTEGLQAMRASGGMTFAQEESGCVVYGMPRSAMLTGAAMRDLSLDAVAATINELGWLIKAGHGK